MRELVCTAVYYYDQNNRGVGEFGPFGGNASIGGWL